MGTFSRSLFLLIPLSLVGVLCACGDQAQDLAAQVPGTNPAATVAEAVPVAPVAAGRMEKGMYFPPEMPGYELHNEYDDDGDGDGIKETHVRRYINSAGDTAFSMTTRGTLWAWSLDTKGDDDSDIHKNFVIRDSNCDKVFDERYSLDAQFHVPACTAQGDTAEKPGGI
jgi:hypothetical protein